MLDQLKRFIKPLQDRVMAMIARAIIQSIDDSKGIQTIKISALAGETLSNIERVQNFGFSSNPPAKAEAVVIFPGGNREHGLCIACDDRATRKKDLVSGESIMYTDDDIFVHLKKGGKLLIKNSSNEWIELTSDLVKAITEARVFTAIGPQPLISQLPNETFPQIKARFDTFKV